VTGEGADDRTPAILEHNKLIADDDRYVSTIVPTRDGVIVAVRVS
jgi:predicted O-methyltransferase YrrM